MATLWIKYFGPHCEKVFAVGRCQHLQMKPPKHYRVGFREFSGCFQNPLSYVVNPSCVLGWKFSDYKSGKFSSTESNFLPLKFKAVAKSWSEYVKLPLTHETWMTWRLSPAFDWIKLVGCFFLEKRGGGCETTRQPVWCEYVESCTSWGFLWGIAKRCHWRKTSPIKYGTWSLSCWKMKVLPLPPLWFRLWC